MGMFDDNDAEYFVEKSSGVPDGLVDVSSYLDTFKNVIDHISVLHPEDEVSKIQFMMSIMNELTKNSSEDHTYEVIASLSFHVVNMIQIGQTFSEDFQERYIHMMFDQIIPMMKDNGGMLPY